MEPHAYTPPSRHEPLCACGKNWWNQEHFGGSGFIARNALDYYKAQSAQGKSPSVAARAAVVYYGMGKPLSYGPYGPASHEPQPKPQPKPPQFTSLEQAEAWLDTQARLRGLEAPKLAVPKFSSRYEADEWLEKQEDELSERMHNARTGAAETWSETQARLRALRNQWLHSAGKVYPTR